MEKEREKDPARAEGLGVQHAAPASAPAQVVGPGSVPASAPGSPGGTTSGYRSGDYRRNSSDSSDSDAERKGRQTPVWKKKYQNGARSRGEWRRKTTETATQELEKEIGGLKDALRDLADDKETKLKAAQALAQQREQDAMLAEAKAKFQGRTWSFTEEIGGTWGDYIKNLIAGSIAVQFFFTIFGALSVACRVLANGSLETEQQQVLDCLAFMLGLFLSWAAYKAAFAIIDRIGRLGRWQRVHRYKASKIRLEPVDPARRPLAMQLTKCEYDHPICAVVSHYFQEELMLLPDWSYLTRSGRPGWRVGFTQHRSKKTYLNVSLEILMQLIVPKNTAVESLDGTMANALTASVKALHAVAVDRISNAVDNIVEETKLAAYGLIKSHKERVQNVPFPRTTN